MIRINLLGVSREALREMAAPVETGGAAEKMAALQKYQWPIVGGVFLLAVGYLGFSWVKLTDEIGRLDEEMAAEEKRKQHLEEVAKKSKEFENKKAELQSKIDIINSLKDNQASPVYMMDEVSSRIDDHVWISQMQMKENSLDISATAFTLTAMTNFMKNLEDSPYVGSTTLKRAADQQGVYGFEITCNLKAVNPKKLNPSPAEGGAAAATGGSP